MSMQKPIIVGLFINKPKGENNSKASTDKINQQNLIYPQMGNLFVLQKGSIPISYNMDISWTYNTWEKANHQRSWSHTRFRLYEAWIDKPMEIESSACLGLEGMAAVWTDMTTAVQTSRQSTLMSYRERYLFLLWRGLWLSWMRWNQFPPFLY